MTSLLLRATVELLEQTSSEDWRKISAETGLKFAWLRQLALGQIADPSVNKIEQLHKHLTGNNFPAAK